MAFIWSYSWNNKRWKFRGTTATLICSTLIKQIDRNKQFVVHDDDVDNHCINRSNSCFVHNNIVYISQIKWYILVIVKPGVVWYFGCPYYDQQIDFFKDFVLGVKLPPICTCMNINIYIWI